MLTHVDKKGNAKMVDISSKKDTQRMAEARGSIQLTPKIMQSILKDINKKGDVLTVAKIAGIQGGKKTSELIPLCHNILINSIEIDFKILKDEYAIECYVTTKSTGATGLEMEALTALSISLLTIYDMCKGIDKVMEIKNISLIKKTGGKSGIWKK
ncbi:cyclic pyranopterin monophosphate synthase MoaC [Methylophilaceae bacterium]|nr:cyclic pyranopterin monophosphate synthase MoaC [Methylophilaceae bacterium]